MKVDIRGNFYYQGEWFDTLEEMFEYAKQWNNSVSDDVTKSAALKRMSDDIILNTRIYQKNFSNYEFSEYVLNVFVEAMRILHAR